VVKAAAKAHVRRTAPPVAPRALLASKGCQFSATHKVVAIGASTGGTEALKDVLSPLHADFPGIVIVQHMPEAFTQQFAARLDSLCKIRVKEAQDGDRILPGHALLAPGHQMAVVRNGMQ
jgi:two-component system, chemotaxis family, protein-glutamate methylesterase/glutaminase